MNPRLDCIELVELVTEYFEATLTIDQSTRLEAHLTECDGCTEYVREMRLTQETLGATAVAIPVQTRAALLAVFRTWKDAGCL